MSKLFINTETIMPLQDNLQFIIKWWLSNHKRIHWVLIRNTSLLQIRLQNTKFRRSCEKKVQEKLKTQLHILWWETYTRKVHLKPSFVKQLFIACINFKTDILISKTVWAISLGKYQNLRNSLGNISNSKFLPGRLRFPIHTEEIENPNLVHQGLIL